MKVLHKCDVTLCVRDSLDVHASHLFLGTLKDNTQDMIEKGRDRLWGRGPLLGA